MKIAFSNMAAEDCRIVQERLMVAMKSVVLFSACISLALALASCGKGEKKETQSARPSVSLSSLFGGNDKAGYEDAIALIEGYIDRTYQDPAERRRARGNLEAIINRSASPKEAMEEFKASYPAEVMDILELQRKAGKGDVEAQLEMGNRCYDGDGVPQNYFLAVRWYSLAADKGNGEAQYKLGRCYDNGFGVARFPEQALKWYRAAEENGVAEAQFSLARLYETGDDATRNMPEAIRFYTILAQKGLAAAQLALGNCYADGRGVEQNRGEAVKLYHQVAEQGDAAAQLMMGKACYYGLGVEADAGEAFRWFNAAAENGDAVAQCFLGLCFLKGKGVERNVSAAADCFAKSAASGVAFAQYLLGYLHDRGLGVGKDEESAFEHYSKAVLKWYRSSLDGNSAVAQYRLARCYATSRGCLPSLSGALRWYSRAAGQGLPMAQFHLANCYALGNGVKQNLKEALRWYKEAAEQGLAEAQYCAGYCYYYGEGTRQSPDKALEYFLRAAENGSVIAMRQLGNCYYLADRVVRNPEEAVKWYAKAAELGDEASMLNLGYCYLNGDGVPQSSDDAREWFEKAASAGNAMGASNAELCNTPGRLSFDDDLQGTYGYRQSERKCRQIREQVVLWARRHAPTLLDGGRTLVDSQKDECRTEINRLFNCRFADAATAYRELDIRNDGQLWKDAQKMVDEMPQYQVDFEKKRQEEIAAAKERYPLYREGQRVSIQFRTGNTPMRTYTGVFRNCGSARIWISQKTVVKADMPEEIRARFEPELNAAVIEREVNKIMEVFTNRRSKSMRDKAEEVNKELKEKRTQTLLAARLVYENGLWHTPSELVEDAIAGWIKENAVPESEQKKAELHRRQKARPMMSPADIATGSSDDGMLNCMVDNL